jgi:O-antigen ligase
MLNTINPRRILFYLLIVGLASLIGLFSATNHTVLILFFVLILAFFVFSFCLRRPYGILLTTVVFLPFTSVVSIYAAGAKISIPDALLLFLGCIMLVRFLFKFDKLGNNKEQTMIMILYSFLLMFSFIFSILCFYKYRLEILLPDWAPNYKSIVVGSVVSNFRLIIPLIVIASVPTLVKTEKDFRKILKCYVFGSFIATCYGFYEYTIKTAGLGFSYLLPGHAQSILFFQDGIIRLSGTFGEPSYFAGFLVLSIFVCMYCKRIKVLPKLFVNFVLLSQLIILVLTYSTVGYLSLVVGIFVYLFYSGRAKFFISIFFLSFLATVLIAYVPAVSEVVQKPFDSSTGQRGSSTDRSNTAKAAINMFEESPVYGIGYGNFSFLYNNFRPEGSVFKYDPAIANNVYADFISSYGLVGIVILLLVVYQFKRSLKKIKIYERREYPFFIGSVMSILVIYMAYPTFNFAYHWVFYSVILTKVSLLKKQ